MSPLLPFFALSFALLNEARGSAVVSYDCPQYNIGACSCLQPYGLAFVQCTGLSNRQQLVDAVRKMTGREITELQIEHSNVSHIPRDLFSDSPVIQITIKHSNMMYLFDRELEKGADQLGDIKLFHVDFGGGLDWSVLNNLKSLRTLNVSESKLGHVSMSASELEIPLETLALEANLIKHIYDLAFQNLKALKNLHLGKNYLERYNRSMLPLPESSIQFLDLSYNRLRSLPSDAFDGMPELFFLNLRANRFTVLERSYMKNVFSSLSFLDVTSNPLICSCDLTWILYNSKPCTLFGDCSTLQEPTLSRNLRYLTKDDFVQCSETDVVER